mmetsp:Transcript_21353/g.46673  ORF Transcript_21353/g.46673 Transcript_21353/m.46673 type:complete len:223 (+) Transcript_21353:400-1068(+)
MLQSASTATPVPKRGPSEEQHFGFQDTASKRQKTEFRDRAEQHTTSTDVAYYPSTSIPSDGWLQPCRYCRSWTAGTISTTEGASVSVCPRCQSKLATYCSAVLRLQHAQQLHLALHCQQSTQKPCTAGLLELQSSSLQSSEQSSPAGYSCVSEPSSLCAPHDQGDAMDSPRLSLLSSGRLVQLRQADGPASAASTMIARWKRTGNEVLAWVPHGCDVTSKRG